MNIDKMLNSIPFDVIVVWTMLLLTLLFFRSAVGREPAQLVGALNSLSPQGWAFLILIIGVCAAILFNRAGIAVDIAAGIIGAGINMFTSQRTPPSGPLPGPPKTGTEGPKDKGQDS